MTYRRGISGKNNLDTSKRKHSKQNLEFTCPLYDTKIAFSVAIGIGASSSSFYYIFNVFGKEHENTWSKIEDFLNRINTPQIKTQRFSLGYMGTKCPEKTLVIYLFTMNKKWRLFNQYYLIAVLLNRTGCGVQRDILSFTTPVWRIQLQRQRGGA